GTVPVLLVARGRPPDLAAHRRGAPAGARGRGRLAGDSLAGGGAVRHVRGDSSRAGNLRHRRRHGHPAWCLGTAGPRLTAADILDVRPRYAESWGEQFEAEARMTPGCRLHPGRAGRALSGDRTSLA